MDKDNSLDVAVVDSFVDDTVDKAVDKAVVVGKTIAEKIDELDEKRIDGIKSAVKENVKNVGYGVVGVFNTLYDILKGRK